MGPISRTGLASSWPPPIGPRSRISGSAYSKELRAFGRVEHPASISDSNRAVKLVNDPALAVLACRNVKHDNQHDDAEKADALLKSRHLINERRPDYEPDKRAQVQPSRQCPDRKQKKGQAVPQRTDQTGLPMR